MVAGDQDTLLAADVGDAECRGGRDVVTFGAASFSFGNFGARRECQKTFGSDFSVFKLVGGDAVSGAAFFFAEGIGVGSHRSEKTFAVEGKCQTKEISLPGVVVQSGIRKIGELIGFQIEDRERLVAFCGFVAGVRAKTAVEKDSDGSVGRNGGRGGGVN